jgi:undecaprenyl-diphosphatase
MRVHGRDEVTADRWRWVAIACLALFLLLLILVVVGDPLDDLDQSVRAAVDAHRSARLTTVARRVTDVLSPGVSALMLALISGAVALRRRHWWPLAVGGVSGWLMGATVLTVKEVVSRPGPIPNSHAVSFPSGHTAAALVCYGTAVMLALPRNSHRRRWLLSGVAALTTTVAAALVYDDYHWLSDVVASAALGTAQLVVLARWLSRQRARRPAPASPTR